MTQTQIIGTDNPLNDDHRRILAIVLDLIVPASEDGQRPSAADVDVLGYIRETEGHTLDGLRAELDQLDAEAFESQGEAFASLDPATRQALVDAVREREPHFMRTLAMQTVTCYYRDDRVLEAIGVGARPPFPEGYEVPSGDLSLLEPVRRRGQIYREA
ncbi:MAG: gluconate 2-dehydrogenase subunit 3 family protein [Gammaproteobacteria bacterium]|nr:gluconate 2-dehydrogenase subunit 3 family protein [Gammaproteobacteria bacterium]